MTLKKTLEILALTGFLTLTGRALAQDQVIKEHTNWDNLRKQEYLERNVRIINSKPLCVFSEFKDKENKNRGFKVYQFKNSNGDLIELYDLENDGYLKDNKNPDQDNTIDGVVVSRFTPKDCFIRKEAKKEGTDGQELYEKATEIYTDMLGKKINKNKFDTSILY